MNANAYSGLLAVLTLFTLGCTTMTTGGGEKSTTTSVKVYGPGQSIREAYKPIEQLWTESRRSAFGAPEFRTADDGIKALQAEAGKLGANGLINVACYKDNKGQWPWHSNGQPVFICYGKAIWVGKPAG